MYGGLDKYIEQYRESVRRMAKAQKLPLVDLDAVIRPRSEQYVLPDGVHLTAEGNEAAAKAVGRRGSHRLEQSVMRVSFGIGLSYE